MPVPTYGAAPLAKTFVMARGLSLVAMVAIVGMTANFVAEIVSTNVEPPREIVGTLTITCLAALYCLVSLPIFYSNANLGLFIMTAIDFLLLLAFVIVSVVLGRPVSFLNCMAIADVSAAAEAQSAAAFTAALASNLGTNGSYLGIQNWAGSTRLNCLETKAIWGMCIALCILFSVSSLILPTLWFKMRKAGAPAKGAA
ncbi:hypothetical protein K431DRAFT_282991 [Polychaeton citri CBS 116435]|uniref:MARVEL domain-containing protein n=1 Tax=Polychaeton citri CBS 116435 TaxID=1314669 RepID=A0A9P4QER7_9PEZI|nr:hypothetical protein K431DRAFT_282991 [Polychaeton citri CBS 116435]